MSHGLNFRLARSIIESENLMTRETEDRLRQLIDHPPEGSAIAEAKEFGVDLYGILENLKLTPAERFRRAAEETEFVQRLRGNIQKADS